MALRGIAIGAASETFPSPTFTGTVTFPDGSTWTSTALTILDPTTHNNAVTINGPSLGAASTASALSITSTWNDAGTTFPGALKVNVTNTASNATSLLADFQLSGVSKFSLSEIGLAVLQGGLTAAGGNITISNGASVLNLRGGGTIISSPVNATLQLGATDAAAPVAQIIQAQSVVAGNANTAGGTFTLGGSKSNGSGGGDVVFQTTLSSAASGTQNTLATALTLKGGTQAAVFAGLITARSATSTTVPNIVVNGADVTTGIGAQANGAVSFISGGVEQLRVISTGIGIQSGRIFLLGNAAVTGLTPGVLAATTNATIVISDNNGQAYRIPCII